MRFGISATSSIFPKNFLTRFRPMNVCAIMPSRLIEPSGSNHNPSHRGDQDDSPEGRNPSRPSGQASDALFSGDSAEKPNHFNTLAALFTRHGPTRPGHRHL